MERSFFQCSEPVPLTDGHFMDITFNGVQFLLLDVVKSEIYKYDCKFCFIETVCLGRKYTSICYDEEEQCYWALSNNNAAIIFRLDEFLHEIGQTRMRNAPQSCANNICYDWYHKTLWVSFSNRIGFTDKGCGEYTFLKNDCEWKSIRNILVLSTCRLVALSSCKRETIQIIQPDCEEKIIIDIPGEYKIVGMCIQQQKEDFNSKKFCICILLTDICCQKSFIMCCTVNCLNHCEPDDCNCSCTEELCQIIHSIALAEVGIAHILNAEGEKIQKAVACSKTTKELLEINESVRCTITHITQLENQLTIKLETALRNSCCKKFPCIK